MATENSTPDTLLGAITYFADVDVATMFVAGLRWPDGVTCPHCDGRMPYVASRRIWQCKGCRKQFSVKVGSLFEDSPIALSKWLPAMWLLVNCKNGVSSYEVARDSASLRRPRGSCCTVCGWRLRRSRSTSLTAATWKSTRPTSAARAATCTPASAGGSAWSRGRSMAGKVAVMALLDRHGKDGHSVVRTEILKNVRKDHLQGHVRKHVALDSNLHTDALASYEGLHGEYVHHVIDHAEAYVDGKSTPTAAKTSGRC